MDVDQLAKSVDPARGITIEIPEVHTIIDRARMRRPPRLQLITWTARSRRPAWAWLVLVMALVAALVFGLRALPSSKPSVIVPVTQPSPSSPTSTIGLGTTSVSLPTSSWFDEISVVDGRLLLSGEVASGTGNSDSCVAATVDPQSLQLSGTTNGSCNDPAIFGETVELVNSRIPNSNDATIRVARIERTPGRVTDGPIVMRYGDLSDTKPETAYGDGWLWIYDVDTTKGPELLQISTSSGRVEDAVTMPSLYRPILAANDSGLWIGNSIQGSSAPYALYHVAPGSSAATGVLAGGSLNTFWLLGSGEDLWAGTGPSFDRQTISRFDGSLPHPVFRVADHGYDPTAVIGDETDGLWTVVPYPPLGSKLESGRYPEDVVRIDPNSGSEKVVAVIPNAVLPSDDAGLTTGQAAYLGGSLFILEPPFDQGGYLGYRELIRVTL